MRNLENDLRGMYRRRKENESARDKKVDERTSKSNEKAVLNENSKLTNSQVRAKSPIKGENSSYRGEKPYRRDSTNKHYRGNRKVEGISNREDPMNQSKYGGATKQIRKPEKTNISGNKNDRRDKLGKGRGYSKVRNREVNRNFNRESYSRILSKSNNLRVCTLSGTNEIGANSSFVEYRGKILVIDAGIGFPAADLYGIDYLIPSVKYLKSRKSDILGIMITHGHLDHIGALPFMIEELGFPPIYAGKFAIELIKQRLEEYKLLDKVELVVVERSSVVDLQPFSIKFIGVTHSIPDSYAVYVENAGGRVLFSGDFKIDEQPINELPTDMSELAMIHGKVDLLLLESTNATVEGKVKNGVELETSLFSIIQKRKGRIIIATFASIVSRIYSLLTIAKRTNRKILFLGRSLRTVVEILMKDNSLQIYKDVIMDDKVSKVFDRDDLLVVCTGSQGEEYSAMKLISMDQHPKIKLKKNDLVILSSSEIPGNIPKIQEMTDSIIMHGADLIKDKVSFVHESGHGLKEDLKMFYKAVEPKFVMPVHGWLTLRYFNKQNLVDWGHNPEKVLLTKNGAVWELENGIWKNKEQIEAKHRMVDGLGSESDAAMMMKDRQALAEYGVLIVILKLSKSGKLFGKPKVYSNGFAMLKNHPEIVKLVEDVINKRITNEVKVRNNRILTRSIGEDISKRLWKVYSRKPSVSIIYV